MVIKYNEFKKDASKFMQRNKNAIIASSMPVVAIVGIGLYAANYMSKMPKQTSQEQFRMLEERIEKTSDSIFIPDSSSQTNFYGCFQIVDLDKDGEKDSLIKKRSNINPSSNGCIELKNASAYVSNIYTTLDNIDYNQNSDFKFYHFEHENKTPIRISKIALSEFQMSAIHRVNAQKYMETAIFNESRKLDEFYVK